MNLKSDGALNMKLALKELNPMMIFLCSIALLTGGCNASETTLSGDIPTRDASGNYEINSQIGRVAGIVVGMREDEIATSGLPFDKKTEILEGDAYTVYRINLDSKTVLICTLGTDGEIARIESSSNRVRDNYGLGVGSSLSELRNSYASGRLIKGTAEGRFANFVTGTKLIFYFNPGDLNPACYEGSGDCDVDESITVESIAIGKYSPN